MVESSSLCGIRYSMVHSAGLHPTLGLRISRDGAMGCFKPPRGGPNIEIRTIVGRLGLGSSIAAIGEDGGQRISRHGVVGCVNVPEKSASQVRSTVGGCFDLGLSMGAFRQERRRSTSGKPSASLRRVRAGNKLENGREESVSSSEEKKRKNVDSSSEKNGGLVEKIEGELGRQFGSALWFSVLLVSLAVFGGGYVFLIINYADFSDIPILRGPQR